MFHHLWLSFLRLAFYLFYSQFAFTYDFVSAFVSRGQWRAWTRAALPYLVGTRVLEIPAGTGNLLLDLRAAGYAAIGADLSAAMLNITRAKFRHDSSAAKILRARVQALPFPNRAFDSITMTFPPGFVRDPRAFAELARVLADEGRLIWVDAARLLPRDGVSRALNVALDAVGGSGISFEDFARAMLARAGFESQVDRVQDDASIVSVVIATRRRIE
ncbi:MAG: methyltransferase domain-containing protein [Anaerolineales bacterium]|nr:methyltransferase domain-containing protein [Anaerolineales bacterium]